MIDVQSFGDAILAYEHNGCGGCVYIDEEDTFQASILGCGPTPIPRVKCRKCGQSIDSPSCLTMHMLTFRHEGHSLGARRGTC